MENLKEDFEVLNELLRTAYKLISPISYHDDIERLTPEFVKQDYVKSPGCYLAIGTGAEHTLFPICNRQGYKDPNIIKFSLKMAKRLAEKNTDSNMEETIGKLTKMLSKYDKPIPNTNSQAALKRKSTKIFNSKMRTPVSEWGNKDLSRDKKVKEFVQDMYNIKQDAKEKVKINKLKAKK